VTYTHSIYGNVIWKRRRIQLGKRFSIKELYKQMRRNSANIPKARKTLTKTGFSRVGVESLRKYGLSISKLSLP
jgi:hypothetical protein